jgi:RNA polymerase sigma factor (sigma-70 family)
VATIHPDAVVRHIRNLVGIESADAPTDRALLQRFISGDESAFAALVARHGPMVLRVCRQILSNAHDAEDAFQATFLVLARKATTRLWRESLAGWLHEVASRVAQKARIAACRRRAHEARARSPVAPDTPGGDITLREAQAALNEELSLLPDRLRTPLVLCYLEGLTQDQAAQQTGWALRTFKRRLWAGKELLQRRLRRRGVVLTAVLSVTLIADTGPASAALLAATTQGAMRFRAGLSTGLEAARADALARGLLNAMFLKHLRNVAALLLVTALAAGAGLGAQALTTPPVRQDAPSEERDGKLFGDPANAPEVVCLGTFGGRSGLTAVAPAPDGKSLASAGDDFFVKLWDLEARKELRTFLPKGGQTSHKWPVRCVTFSPDGETVASGSIDTTIRLWDATTGKERAVLSGHTVFVQALAFSPDGKLLASGSGGQPLAFTAVNSFRDVSKNEKDWSQRGEVKVWDLAARTERTFFRAETGRVTSVAFSPDGKTLASGGWDGAVRLWDVGTGKERARLREDGELTSVAFSPDGKTLASASRPDFKGPAASSNKRGVQQHEVTLRDPATGRVRARLSGHTGWVAAVAFSPDGRILATASTVPAGGTGEDATGEVRLWDAGTFKPVGAPLTCPHRNFSLAFGAGGKILVAAGPRATGSGEITLWNLRTRGAGR